jgi:hypothetical protein
MPEGGVMANLHSGKSPISHVSKGMAADNHQPRNAARGLNPNLYLPRRSLRVKAALGELGAADEGA